MAPLVVWVRIFGVCTMLGDRNKKIELGGVNLSKAEKLEVCLAHRLMSHIDTCTPHELIRIFRLVLGDCDEARLLEKDLT